MAWFFVQVWVLCVVAFLLGAAVTWLAFVRPLRREREVTSWPVLKTWPADHDAPPGPADRDTPEPLRPPAAPPADPALAVVDPHGLPRPPAPGAGVTASDAIDGLAAAPAIPEQAERDPRVDTPDIPPQHGPVDLR